MKDSSTSTFISITTRAEFIHSYPNAPEQVHFLRSPHRHILHISAEIEVFSDDRELEFIVVKRDLEFFIRTLGLEMHSTRSCETVGRSILEYLKEEYGARRSVTITVSEDGENSAIIKYNP